MNHIETLLEALGHAQARAAELQRQRDECLVQLQSALTKIGELEGNSIPEQAKKDVDWVDCTADQEEQG